MIQINLLPLRARKRRGGTANQFLLGYAAAVVLTFFTIGYVWISQSNEAGALNGQLRQVQNEVAKYTHFETLLNDLQQKKDLVDKKRAIIEELQRDRDTTVRILALLGVQIPQDEMWFERLTQTSNTITIDGVALSNEAVAEFMRNLESSPYVQKGSVNLIHSRQTVMNDMKLREFQVTYRFFPFSEVQKINNKG
jgi:type IV pilus assembly protein PilN